VTPAANQAVNQAVNQSAKRLLVLIPAFNEEGAVAGVVAEVRSAVPGAPVLVVDDCSRDSTRSQARGAGAMMLALPHHLGLGGCVQAGYRLAYELGYDYVIRVDGDGQHDPRDIPTVLAALEKGDCEMVIGSRFVDDNGAHTSFVRAAGIMFFRAVLRPILGRPVRDPTSGYVGVNRTALELFSATFPLEYPEIEALVVLQRKRFRFVEVPCRFRPRRSGRSTITAVKSLYYIIHVLLGVFVNVLKFEGRRK
jgi:glycosyltransferase involved in cell wall biosynthesis